MAPALIQRPRSVVELDNHFLQLFPHRFDYLFAAHPDPGTSPDWLTESRHPLSDRILQQGTYLYGVRFGTNTCYALLDIDQGSPYHPKRDPLAIPRMMDALEAVGLVRYLCVQSSDSGGFHLYLPFTENLPSWQVGLVISTLLENHGFKVMPGWLEVFPNQRHASPDGQLSLFNGHRLPLQQGSYVLSGDFEPIASSQVGFVQRWSVAAQQNTIDRSHLDQVLRTALRRNYRVSNKAAKFLNDLNCEIELGWTDFHQTNRLLGRIALRSYVFGHVLYAASPLMGKALVDDIVRIAKNLPGFHDWCRHKHDLRARAEEWARSIEGTPRYYPYAHDTKPGAKPQDGPNWNEQQQTSARERIEAGVADLMRRNIWPSNITTRFDALVKLGISGSTLYKNRDLWHPQFISEQRPDTESTERMPDCLEGSGQTLQAYSPTGCNPSDSKALTPEQPLPEAKTGCNPSDLNTSGLPEQIKRDTLQALAAARTALEAERKHALSQRYVADPQRMATYVAQLHEWVASGDPIMVMEGLARLQALGHGDFPAIS